MLFFDIFGIVILCYWLFYLIAFLIIDCDLELAFLSVLGKSIGKLKGKVVFIVGASSGIGKETALVLAKHGVKLVLAARRMTELENVKKLCLEASKGSLEPADILVLPMDILDILSQKHHFDTAIKYFGRLDVLFNNAGKFVLAQWESIDLEVDRNLFDLNVFAIVNLTRIAVIYFKERGYGHVAATTSIAGVFPAPNCASYVGSKYAMNGYYNSLRIENLNSKLAVTLICPGGVATDILRTGTMTGTGEAYGNSQRVFDPKDKTRMSAPRCGYLCAVALANQTRESWIGKLPTIPFTYFYCYWPNLSYLCLRMLGSERLSLIKDISVQEAPTQVRVSAS